MMLPAIGEASTLPRLAATSMALVISLPILAMQVQEILGRRPDIELRLTAHGVAEFAAFAGRDWVDVIVCSPAEETELRGLIHSGQRLMVLELDEAWLDSQRDPPAATARPAWPSFLEDVVRPPAMLQFLGAERRSSKPDISRRNMAAWLLKQHGSETQAGHHAKDYARISADQWILTSVPHLGRATAVVFLSTQRIPQPTIDFHHLLKRLRSALRAEDAILRLDDSTFVVLMAVPTQAAIPSLLIRLSWRLWPADPDAVAASHAVWQPGQDIEGVIAAGRLSLFAALGFSHKPGTVITRHPPPATGFQAPHTAEAPMPAWEAPHPALRRRGLPIEPWCAGLPGFAGETALQLAVEAQEEEEFGHVGHGLGVARISEGLGAAMGLSADLIDQLRTAALFHDGGKLALDSALWGSRGTIMPWQRKLMEAHASFGSELADQVGVPDEAVMAILHHHERWDGTGYPAKLDRDLIPLPARILFVAEVIDSMLRASYRRQPLAPLQVADVLAAGAGHIWDPEVVEHAVRMVRGSA